MVPPPQIEEVIARAVARSVRIGSDGRCHVVHGNDNLATGWDCVRAHYLEEEYWIHLLRCIDQKIGVGVTQVAYTTHNKKNKKPRLNNLHIFIPVQTALLMSLGCKTGSSRVPFRLLDGCFILAPHDMDSDVYRQAAQRLLEDPRSDEDKRATEWIANHGLWVSEGGGHPGLKMGIGMLPPGALQGIDHPGDPDSPPLNAWRQLCMPSPLVFTHTNRGKTGSTILEMAEVPIEYGTWEDLHIVS